MNIESRILIINEILEDSTISLPKVKRELLESFKMQLELERKNKRLQIFELIAEERNRQDKKFGVQNHHPFAWLAILGEEVGEVNKAALETEFNYDGCDRDFTNYKTELVQVAAVALAMIENMERNPIQYR